MKKYKILNQLHENYLVAVVRGNDEDETKKIVDEIIKGGFKNIEITFTVPNAEEVINQVHKQYGDDIVLGAGTVLDAATAQIAINKGAQYIVSPHLDTNISKLCNIYSIPYLPGCSSATEIIEALRYGSDLIKLFPGGQLGAGFIKDIKGPVPNVELMPSGGVNLDNVSDWIEKGSFAVGIGGDLTKEFTGNNFEVISEKAQKYVEAVRNR
ncbi:MULTISPECIES: bifunctional 2-keto-4-hydroxyglutarate aldolase/2-keto-3-deoxy-6-phosphogluconate aldolase [Mammaliicoccus]|uniref:Bifunctional 2-keto-4-hydroxyglutarate aldolase/2-keto-3-deoxy-6-phosphogluconate aldolase n=1 Tax=Mammaliicoccus sciuri TaxID=1296 RepID=A0AAW5LEK9_MAMSC|nr:MULTISPECIES: bifunctional 2-keto-4-hydroxyglutarate aldolase/2-keto-3-deoxy-6-phosphogluconate aldolase [Mammaliicoccus]KTT85072.1 2-dehydro-3-deoxyphosphogluconate aldolase [Mammaliicoccus sciuri]MBA1395907.1 bifunctional 4-hydroxy-2-oxoglutarate aldolase/2-dehydro-3-deoxy-phosphogluconate aldolase [Mammaliicoccus sciuri]MBF0772524.1 bifunctional 2-keto-4-hydroxyglutarate aldolase/2-keto-3-deoxy-6-phosphogluconate aldolase [Mammaliicoccus sciuri]MBO1209584.1 bifunctional 2-keto-4-hydroxygl